MLPRQDRRFSRRLESQNPLLTDGIYSKFREESEFELRLPKSAKKGGKTLKYLWLFLSFLDFCCFLLTFVSCLCGHKMEMPMYVSLLLLLGDLHR